MKCNIRGKNMREKVKVTIDGVVGEFEKDTTILEAARSMGIDIPTLCYLKEVNEIGACRMCIVEVEGMRGFVTSCTTKVSDGMVVRTRTKELIETRKNTLELIISNHNRDCLTCIRNTNCELQNLSRRLGVKEIRYKGAKTEPIYDDSSLCITRDTSKCILCGRCVNICKDVQTVAAITKEGRGFKTKIAVAEGYSIANSTCVGCGQCIVNCPVGALKEKDYISEVVAALNDENKLLLYKQHLL